MEDLLLLLPEGTTADDVKNAIQNLKETTGYSLRGDLLLPRGQNDSNIEEFNTRLKNSRLNLDNAKWLAKVLGPDDALTMAVSGSTSYGAATGTDDLDFFSVTDPGGAWIFISRALILSRAFRLSRRGLPSVCLSCVTDSPFAHKMFQRDGGALFARDALVVEVVRGEEAYKRLLANAEWMQRYFPRLYKLRTRGQTGRTKLPVPPSTWKRILNSYLFATLGTYIRAKVFYHNVLLRRQRKDVAAFRVRLGPDHLIYESAKYESLKRTYMNISPLPLEDRSPAQGR